MNFRKKWPYLLIVLGVLYVFVSSYFLFVNRTVDCDCDESSKNVSNACSFPKSEPSPVSSSESSVLENVITEKTSVRTCVGNPSLSLRPDFKIFIYPVPDELFLGVLKEKVRWWAEGDLCLSDPVYAGELGLLYMLGNSTFVTKNPEEASFFVIPHLTFCYYHYRLNRLKIKDYTINFGQLDTYFDAIFSWVVNEYPYFNRSRGLDHILISGHEMFQTQIYHPRKELSEVILITSSGGILRPTTGYSIFKEGLDNSNHKDIVGMPVYIPPKWIVDASLSKLSAKLEELPLQYERRDKFDVYFRGFVSMKDYKYSLGCRQSILEYVRTNKVNAADGPYGGKVLFDTARTDLKDYHVEMAKSKFCLHVQGWVPWSGRISNIFYWGCIPVIVADEIILPFQQNIDWSEFSIKIKGCDPEHIFETLMNVPPEVIQKKIEKLREVRKKFLYNWIPEEGDAFYQIMNILARREFKYGISAMVDFGLE